MKNFIVERIKYYANYYGNNIAIVFNEHKISYKELDYITDKYADIILRKINYRRNVPIIIYRKRDHNFLLSIISVIKAHCFYIPLESDTPVSRVHKICEKVNPAAVICDSENSEIMCNVIDVELPIYDKNEPNTFYDVDISEEDIVYVIFTSGTTGTPKGVKISYSNLYNLIKSMYKIIYHEFDKKVNVGVMASFNFDASVKQIFSSIYFGHTLVISDGSTRYFGRKIHNFHNKYNLKICDCTPTHLQMMNMQKTDTPSLIPYLFVGGENLCWDTLYLYKKTFNYLPIIINVYGPTECCVDASYNFISKLPKNKSGNVAIGKPVNNTELVIIDEYGRIISELEKCGELVIVGSQVGSGYYNEESKSFIKNSQGKNVAYKTGDLAKYISEKEIVIVSRLDNQVKINGNRVELSEISCVISDFIKLPCAVLLSNNKRYESNFLIAYIYGIKINKSELIKYLKTVLPSYMIPSKFIATDIWPLTQNGKLDEKRLRKISGIEL